MWKTILMVQLKAQVNNGYQLPSAAYTKVMHYPRLLFCIGLNTLSQVYQVNYQPIPLHGSHQAVS